MTSSTNSFDVVVVGGGVIGLSIAWRVGQEGLRVALVDPDPGGGVSSIAAGMLGPTTTRSAYAEEELQNFNAISAAAYPAFSIELEEVSGMKVGYEHSGGILVAVDAKAGEGPELSFPAADGHRGDGVRFIESVYKYQASLGLPVQMISSEQCRLLEPCISPQATMAVLYEDEGHVDSRRLCQALVRACRAVEVNIHLHRVVHLITKGREAKGVLLDDGRQLDAASIVLAAGAWSHLLNGLPEMVVQPLRPLKGQVVRVRSRMDAVYEVPSRTIRAHVNGRHVYVVPQLGGQAVVGATLEDVGYDTSVTVEAMHRLLHDASLVVPSIGSMEVVNLGAGLRPVAADNVPMIGASFVEGLFLATGHGRNGVLLAPATAEAVCKLITKGVVDESIRPFSPKRFYRETDGS